MRIIGGQFRGLHLAPLGAGDPKAHLRPTSDRVRESIFNLLINGGHGDPITGAHVLDLFAGTGALGLEALSRGATQATFVDSGIAACTLLRRNIELTRTINATNLWRRDATKMGTNKGDCFGLIFLDPPYGKALGEATLPSLLANGWLAPDALIVWEEGVPPLPPAGFDTVDKRRYSDTYVTLLRVKKWRPSRWFSIATEWKSTANTPRCW